MILYPELNELALKLISGFDEIPVARKSELKIFADAIRESINQFGRADIIVICTHNSRRSQLGQLALKTAALYYNLKEIHCFSGGTEATAFNYRMVLAIKRAGFRVNQVSSGENPKFYIPVSDNDYNLDIYYSKRFDESYNPGKNFIAVMVCSQADEACPFVPGAFKRISLPYADPKDSDESENETQVYGDKVNEIFREMLYAVSLTVASNP